MVNPRFFALNDTLSGCPSVGQLLNFFKSAPRLRKIELDTATLATGDQSGRLVSLACLKRMVIVWCSPSSISLDHLLVPVGAKLKICGNSFRQIIEDRLPTHFDNLRNISGFTKIHFQINENHTRMELCGPNGQLSMSSKGDAAHLGLGSLARLDTSKVEQLEVVSGDHSLDTRSSYRALLPLENLRTLTLSRCRDPYTFMAALGSNTGSSVVVACPKLEEIVLVPRTDTEGINIESVTKIAAARASRGTKLRTVRIVGGKDKLDPGDVLELRKHVLNVEYDPVVDVVDSDSDDSDEDSW